MTILSGRYGLGSGAACKAATDDRRMIRLLLWLVILPALSLSAVGVLLLWRGEVGNILLGILVIIFCVTLATGTILVWVFVRQQKNL